MPLIGCVLNTMRIYRNNRDGVKGFSNYRSDDDIMKTVNKIIKMKPAYVSPLKRGFPPQGGKLPSGGEHKQGKEREGVA